MEARRRANHGRSRSGRGHQQPTQQRRVPVAARRPPPSADAPRPGASAHDRSAHHRARRPYRHRPRPPLTPRCPDPVLRQRRCRRRCRGLDARRQRHRSALGGVPAPFVYAAPAGSTSPCWRATPVTPTASHGASADAVVRAGRTAQPGNASARLGEPVLTASRPGLNRDSPPREGRNQCPSVRQAAGTAGASVNPSSVP